MLRLKEQPFWAAMGIAGYTLGISLMMVAIEMIWVPGYWIKAAYKLVFFLIIPLLLMHFLSKGGVSNALKRVSFRRLRPVFLLSALSSGVLIVGYFVIRRFIDEGSIAAQLGAGPGVGVGNFIPIAVYIALVNSLVEELFFRGFAFLLLRNYCKPWIAAIWSSFCFAFYHIGIIDGWFHPILLALAIGGLALVGGVFCYMDHREGSILPAWIFHICGNIAINSVGLVILDFIPL